MGSAAALPSGSLFAHSTELFSSCRKPWSEYLDALPKADAQSYAMPDVTGNRPMYRGRKFGREGNLMGESVQLHYRRYPDEGIYKNLNRWLHGDVVEDVQLQQFRNVQPFNLERPDPNGFETPSPEIYMKLNYKNPAVLSRFLTRTGHYYPMDVYPLNPYACLLLRTSLYRARLLGLYPRAGNPFWHRVQKDRPAPVAKAVAAGGSAPYDPTFSTVKQTVEQFCFNWLQTRRIQQYFERVNASLDHSDVVKAERLKRLTRGNDVSGYDATDSVDRYFYDAKGVAFSEKVSTVPGLMSTQGLKKSRNLYSKSSKRRMGYPNPLTTTKRI